MRQFSTQSVDHRTSQKYQQLLADFEANGDTWTAQQARDFFNDGFLEVEIRHMTGFNFNFDYKNPTNKKEISVIYILKGLYNIITYFQIHIGIDPAPNISCVSLAEWFAKAAECIEEIIRPLLDKLKRFEPLSRLGVERTRLLFNILKCEKGHSTCYTPKDLAILNKQINAIEKYISDFLLLYFEDIKWFFHKTPYNLSEIKIEFINISPRIRLFHSEALNLIEKLPPLDGPGIFRHPQAMRILNTRSLCGFEAVASGLIFLAQQELDQPLAQRPVFNKIATLTTDITKNELETMISDCRFNRHGLLYSLEQPRVNDQFTTYELIRKLTSLLRHTLVRHRLTNLVKDLKNERCTLQDPIWSDILQVFWHNYDSTPLPHNSYVLCDETIRRNIESAVQHIKRLEKSSNETYLDKRGTPHLTSSGFWLLVSRMLVAYQTNLYATDQFVFSQQLFEDGFNLLSTLKIIHLEYYFLHYYCKFTLAVNYNISSEYESRLKIIMPYICRAASYLNDISLLIPDTTIVSDSYQYKYPREKMLELLRAHLALDPRFGIIPKEDRRNPTNTGENYIAAASRFIGSLFSRSNSTSSINHEGAELKPMRSSGYGTCSSSSTTRGTSLMTLDKNAILQCQANETDIITLAEELFNVCVIFHNNPPCEQIARSNEEKPIMHLYKFNLTEICLFIDPFPNPTATIPYLMELFAAHITTANLAKDEIYRLFNEVIPLEMRAIDFRSISTIDNRLTLAIMIRKKCLDQTTTVPEVLEFIKLHMPNIKSSSDNFTARVDYLFYRFYGKSFAEVVAKPQPFEYVSASGQPTP